MRTLIGASFARPRTILCLLALILVAGFVAYRDIPKEADPDVQIPIVYVSVTQNGISPEDAERLLIRPLETELQGLEGTKEMRSEASEGHASVVLEFQVGTDIDRAILDVREKVDRARAELPEEAEEPIVEEVNLSLFPVVVVTLSGEVPERPLVQIARDLEDRLEALPDVLDAEIAGDREELLEILIDPVTLETYGLRHEQIVDVVSRNNRLVTAGALDSGTGRFAIKVPGLFETAEDLMNLPLRASGNRVVTLGDVAEIHRTFKDAEGFARVDGRPAIALEVSKRIGANIIDTIAEVRRAVEVERAGWPESIEVAYSQDKSDDIRQMLGDLQNNVLSAVVIVMIVTVAAMGLRASALIGLAVPGAFLAAVLFLHLLGYTVNVVVLFGLILSAGMVVDGATVVVEYADRRMVEGARPRAAYLEASTRMAWPVISATATTLCAFLPLAFWPGIVGEFMVYMPITVLATLTAALAMAMIFTPVIGAMIGRPGKRQAAAIRAVAAHEERRPETLSGPTGAYVRMLRPLLSHPGKVLAAAVVVLVGAWAAYGTYGRGVEFFPAVEPDLAQALVHARGDLSVEERDALVREVEDRILRIDGVAMVYTRSAIQFREDEVDPDVIGRLMFEFTDWRTRRPASEIMAEIRARTADLAGIRVEVREQEAGPPVGKAIQLELAARDPALLEPAVERVRAHLDDMPGLVDVGDSRPSPGLEWRLQVNREHAARFGADIASVGSAVQLVTNGILIDTYRPDDADDEVDIRVRFPPDERSLGALDRLRIETALGLVPLSSFVERVPAPKVGEIARVDGRRALTVTADVAPGVLAADQLAEIQAWLAADPLDPGVSVVFRGEDEEQKEASAFLWKAFGIALFLIAIILVTQFNSFYQTFLILTAVVFSTVGVLLGLLATGQPFGIVMNGISVIALAGIVVNNNIILIDTYNEVRQRGIDAREAILRTCAQRLRPVYLTTVTTILGVMPMALGVNIDLFARTTTFGGPSTDWWRQLSTAIAGGLTFATLLTLVLTPCMLALGADVAAWVQRRRARSDEPAPPDLLPQMHEAAE